MCASRGSGAVVAVVVLLLIAAAPAHGKGIARLQVCGPDRCVDRTRAVLSSASDPHVMLDMGTPVADQAVTAEPFVRLRIGVGDGVSRKVYGRFVVTFLPRAGLLQAEDGSWGLAQGEQRRILRRLSRAVDRFPARRLHLVAVPEPTATPRPRVVAQGAGGGSGRLIAGGGAAVLATAAAAIAFARRRRRAEDGPAV